MATFTNVATLSYNGNTITSNTVTGNIIEVLSATKTALVDSYSPNDEVTYVISISNTGNTALTGVTVTDNMGEYTSGSQTLVPLDYIPGSVAYYSNGAIQPQPVITSTSPLTISGLTVPAGGNALVLYQARTNSFAPPGAGGTVTNIAEIAAEGIATSVTATETISAAETPNLSITKALNPVNVTENSEITYTFTIQNTGNTAIVATDNVVISDTFDPAITNISVQLNGAVLPAGSYSYSEATGVFTTEEGVITVPAATYTQNPATGVITTTPGITVITVTGTI